MKSSRPLLKAQFIKTAKITILALVVGLGTSYIFAAWSPPTVSPPGCVTGNPGCDDPINTSSITQTKTGTLALNTAVIWNNLSMGSILGGVSYPASLQYIDGHQAAGKVLTSDSQGDATWQPSVGTDTSGGVYMVNYEADAVTPYPGADGCRYINPLVATSTAGNYGCSCPPGYSSHQLWEFYNSGYSLSGVTYYSDQGTHAGNVAMYQCILTTSLATH